MRQHVEKSFERAIIIREGAGIRGDAAGVRALAVSDDLMAGRRILAGERRSQTVEPLWVLLEPRHVGVAHPGDGIEPR